VVIVVIMMFVIMQRCKGFRRQLHAQLRFDNSQYTCLQLLFNI
jgi:hypothetical protein